LLYFHVFLGAKYGEFNITSALRSADTLSKHIYELAEKARSELKEILKESLESGAVCVSPDMWSDSHRQVPYLGMTTTFVNHEFKFKVIDLCCRPFTGDDQSAKNVLIVSKISFCIS